MRPMELAQHYIDRFVINDETARNYLVIARLFEEATDLHDIAEVTLAHVTTWRKSILSRLSVHSYNTYLRHLRILYQHAQDQQLVGDNPFSCIDFVRRMPKSKCVPIENVALVIRQLEVENICDPGWFWAIVIRFLLSTGMRRRQLVALCWEHIDFERRTILLIQESSKNCHEWTIPMTDGTYEDLKILHKRTQALRGFVPSNQQVFCLPLFNPRSRLQSMSKQHVSGFFCDLSKKSGIRISAHRIRHTLGTRLGTSEHPDIVAIQELFGHKSITSTRRYVASNVGHIRRVLDRDGFEQELASKKKSLS